MPNMIKEFDCEDLGSSNETVTRLYHNCVMRGGSVYLKKAFKDCIYG